MVVHLERACYIAIILLNMGKHWYDCVPIPSKDIKGVNEKAPLSFDEVSFHLPLLREELR